MLHSELASYHSELRATQCIWCLGWVHAEAALGKLHEGLRSNDPRMIAETARVWSFIEAFMVDRIKGDRRLRVTLSGAPDPSCPLVTFWKDAGHEARACLDISRLCEVATVFAAKGRDNIGRGVGA